MFCSSVFLQGIIDIFVLTMNWNVFSIVIVVKSACLVNVELWFSVDGR